eukprot:scaffold25729_cov137-Cylindrotheca_fusiformis.AAC.2
MIRTVKRGSVLSSSKRKDCMASDVCMPDTGSQGVFFVQQVYPKTRHTYYESEVYLVESPIVGNATD